MDFSWSLRTDQIMGGGLAAAIVSRCDCVGDLVVSRWQLGLWINCWSRCVECLWGEFAESARGHTSAHRHAVGIGDFSHRPVDLEKNPRAGRMEPARSSLPLRTTDSLNVNQRSDCLRLFASRDCAFPMALW